MKKTAEEVLKAEFVDGEWEELMSYMNTDITPSIVGAMEKYLDQFRPKWINTTHSLPSDDSEYLFVNQWGSIFLGQFYDGRWIIDGVPENFETNVTHWQPLPSAPERKEVER